MHTGERCDQLPPEDPAAGIIQVLELPGPLPTAHHLVTSLLGDARHWGTTGLLPAL